MKTAKLTLDGREVELPVVVGTEGETGIDISTLRAQTGAVTLDSGYANTGSCTSAVTFIDGEKGILRYRGYPIEELAARASFEEICHLLIWGRLPNRRELDGFRHKLTYHSLIHEAMKKLFEDFPPTAHPMAVLSAMVASLSAYYGRPEEDPELNIVRLLAKTNTLAAFSYKKSIGQPFVYPRNDLSYTENFLHMMFAVPSEPYTVPPALDRALNLLLILHADHEQNCSTSSVRMVGSSQTNLFAAVSAGICALWGPLHGGANQEVIQMLKRIRDDGGDYRKYVAMAKDKASGMPKVSAAWQILDAGGGTVNSAPPSIINPTSLGRLSRLVGTKLDGYAPGEYELVMNFKDEISGKTVELREPFTVVAAGS